MIELRQVIKQMIAEEISALFGPPDEDYGCEDCPAIGPLMSIVERQGNDIKELRFLIEELEKRHVITAEPIQTTAFDHLYRPWNITYTRPE